MQKKIIVLAIAAALTSPALALADAPTVYGAANVSIDRVNNGATVNGVVNNRLVSNESNLGVKGSTDLGNGLTGVYQIEGTIGMDGSTNGAPGGLQTNGQVIAGTTTMTASPGFALDRDTFIGVAGSFGTFVAGQHDTPYKIADRGLDVFADTVAADNRSLMGNVSLLGSGNTGLTQDARVANAIAYISPAMGGVTIAAATVFGAETAGNGTKKGSALSLAALYSNGPIFADVAYQSIKIGDTGTGDLGFTALSGVKASGLKAGVGFNGGAFAVNAVIEKSTETPVTGSNTTNNNFYLAGKFNLSAENAVKAAYTKQGDQSTGGTTVKTGAKQIAVGFDHALNKTSTVYALYAKTSFSATNSASPSTLSAGFKHSF